MSSLCQHVALGALPFLDRLDAAWGDHCSAMLLTRQIFLYLDRTHVLQVGPCSCRWGRAAAQRGPRHVEVLSQRLEGKAVVSTAAAAQRFGIELANHPMRVQGGTNCRTLCTRIGWLASSIPNRSAAAAVLTTALPCSRCDSTSRAVHALVPCARTCYNCAVGCATRA